MIKPTSKQSDRRIQIITALMLAVAVLVFSLYADAHDGNFSAEPWAACAAQELDDSCSFSNSNEDVYRGTCQAMAEEALICVRNQPIEKHDPEFAAIHDH